MRRRKREDREMMLNSNALPLKPRLILDEEATVVGDHVAIVMEEDEKEKAASERTPSILEETSVPAVEVEETREVQVAKKVRVEVLDPIWTSGRAPPFDTLRPYDGSDMV